MTRDPVHEIASTPDGIRIGTDGVFSVTLMERDGRMFKRRAIKNAGTPDAEETCWLVVELDGVRVYQRGDQVVVSRVNLYP